MVLLAVCGPGAVAADEPVTGRLAGAFCGEAIGGCEPPCGGLVGWPIIVVPEFVPPAPVVEFVWARARDVVPSNRAPIAPSVFNFVIAYSRIVSLRPSHEGSRNERGTARHSSGDLPA